MMSSDICKPPPPHSWKTTPSEIVMLLNVFTLNWCFGYVNICLYPPFQISRNNPDECDDEIKKIAVNGERAWKKEKEGRERVG